MAVSEDIDAVTDAAGNRTDDGSSGRSGKMERLNGQFETLLETSQDWLTNRIITLAIARGYTSQTSTLRKAWETSINGLSQAMIELLRADRIEDGVDLDTASGNDPSVLFGTMEARRHRERGVTLGTFLGLTKSYRQVYLELGVHAGLSQRKLALFQALVGNFYDRMEIALCTDWVDEPMGALNEQLRMRNRELANEKNKYLTIFESLQDPVFLVDRDGLIENMNFAASRQFSSGNTPGDTYYGETKTRLGLEALLGVDCLADGDDDADRRLMTNDGPKWYTIKTQPMLDVSEKFVGTVVILNDVTELYQAKERAEAAARVKSDFLATMSHEIRTPIHGIMGTAELLLQSDLSASDRAYVDAIAYSSDILTSLVSDVLDYSRIEAGALAFDQVAFSIDELIGEVAQIVRPTMRRKPEVQLVIEQPDLPQVVGDAGKVRQILLNLVGNALKFTQRGMVRIIVETIEGGEAGHNFRFTVSDTGIGIAADRLQDIFEPFTQSDGSVSRRYGGTGLGLAICHRLAEALGGRLGVSSEPGVGSRFWFDLALGTQDEEPNPHPARTGSEDIPAAKALRVLVVEDNEVNALVASNLLAAAGHEVVVAVTGEEALVAIADGVFDVVLTDLQLPDSDGFDLARVIRNDADRKKASVPIIALSAHGKSILPETLRSSGIDDYLGKPFRFARLEAILRRVVGSSSPRPIQAYSASVKYGAAGCEIDENVLREHVAALGVAAADQIVVTFRRSIAETARDLGAAIDQAHWPAVAAIAHRLRSSARHVGLVMLSRRAELVEHEAGRNGERAAALALELVLACAEASDLLDRTWVRITRDQAEKT